MTFQYSLSVLLAIATLFSAASSQLTTCAPSLCPDTQHCAVGNTTLTQLGITEVPSNFSTSNPQSLAWTLGTSSFYQPESSSNATFTKSYYLSSPASFSISGCALFFEGLAATKNVTTTDGSCKGIADQCVKDLEGMAKQLKNAGGATSENGTINRCDALSGPMPDSCKDVAGAGFGMVTVRDLAAMKSNQISNSSVCYPTLQHNSTLSLVNTYQRSIEYDLTSDWQNFMNGVTPVLTLLDYGVGRFEGSLRCLKTIEAPAVTDSGAGSSSVIHQSSASRDAASGWIAMGFFASALWQLVG